MLLREKPCASFREENRGRLDALRGEGSLEVSDDPAARGGVRLGPRDQRVERGTCGRQLLRRANPSLGHLRQQAEQLAQSLLVVALGLTAPDSAEGSFLPASAYATASSSESLAPSVRAWSNSGPA